MTTDSESTKRWLKIVSFLLFLVFILAGTVCVITAELFGQLFDAVLGKDMLNFGLAHFFQTLPIWIWAAASILGLLLCWMLIRLRMRASGGNVPVKTTMILALTPIAVIVFEVFAFIAPSEEIGERFKKEFSEQPAKAEAHNHEGHSHSAE